MPVGWSAEDLPAALQGRHGWRALVDDLLADSSPAAPLRSPSGHVAMQEEGSSKPSDGRDLDDAEGADGKDAEMGVVPDGAAAAPAPPVENSSAGNGGDQPLKKAKSQTDKGDHAWCSIVKCGGQGACFYNSFGAAYGMQKDSMTWDAISKTIWSRGRTIRSELADFVCKRPQRYQEYIAFDPEAELVGRWTDTEGLGSVCRGFEEASTIRGCPFSEQDHRVHQ